MYIQDNHKKYPKGCVYWIGPFIGWLFTADIETMKIFFHQSGGMYLMYTIHAFYCMSTKTTAGILNIVFD